MSKQWTHEELAAAAKRVAVSIGGKEDDVAGADKLIALARAWGVDVAEKPTRTWEVRFWLGYPVSQRKLGYPRLCCRVEAADIAKAVSRVRECYGRYELDEVVCVGSGWMSADFDAD